MTKTQSPYAETLDEATLRRVFPDAPADIEVPRDVSALFKARMREVGGSNRTFWIILLAAAIVGGIALLLVGLYGAGGFVILLVVLLVAIVAGIQHSRAHKDFFGRYATARGLVLGGMADTSADVPLLRRGDEQDWERQLVGTIAGQPATLALYTYTEITRDSEGNTSRSNYDFTLLRFRLPSVVAQRFRGVYLAPKSLSFGSLQDKMSHDRKVELESQAFHKRYSLRVVDEQDDIALYELFSPPFIELLSTHAHVNWEQVGDSLVVYRKDHETEAADLDRFCLEAWHVLQRYLEEHR